MEKRFSPITIYFDDAEQAAINTFADGLGLPVASYIRMLIFSHNIPRPALEARNENSEQSTTQIAIKLK